MKAVFSLFQQSWCRFLLVGGTLALITSVLTALAVSALPFPRSVSAALVWMAMIGPGYHSQRRFAFRAQNSHRHGLWLYAGCQVIGVMISAFAAFAFARGAFWPDLLVFLLASALAAVISYLVSRLVIFPAAKP